MFGSTPAVHFPLGVHSGVEGDKGRVSLRVSFPLGCREKVFLLHSPLKILNGVGTIWCKKKRARWKGCPSEWHDQPGHSGGTGNFRALGKRGVDFWVEGGGMTGVGGTERRV